MIDEWRFQAFELRSASEGGGERVKSVDTCASAGCVRPCPCPLPHLVPGGSATNLGRRDPTGLSVVVTPVIAVVVNDLLLDDGETAKS